MLGYGYSYHNEYNSFILLLMVTAILAIILMLTFLSKRNEDRYDGFLKDFYEFLNFKKLTISAILKFAYLFLAILCAFVSIMMLFNNGIDGIIMAIINFVISEAVLRVSFEASMLLVIGVTNLIEINKKINNKKDQDISFFEPDTDRYASIISEQANKVKDKIKEQTEKKDEVKEDEVAKEPEIEENIEEIKKPKARKKTVQKEESSNIEE